MSGFYYLAASPLLSPCSRFIVQLTQPEVGVETSNQLGTGTHPTSDVKFLQQGAAAAAAY